VTPFSYLFSPNCLPLALSARHVIDLVGFLSPLGAIGNCEGYRGLEDGKAGGGKRGFWGIF